MFDNSYILLVLTCDRRYYKDRLQNNSDTFAFFRELGFKVVYLYANPKIDQTLIEQSNNDYKLTVSCMEIYELLSLKMELAFQYFENKNVKGILKIDDDIRILNKEDFKTKICPNFVKYDYYGIYDTIFSYNAVSNQTGQFFNNFHRNNYTYNCFKNIFLRLNDLNIRYMSGPFYWVSNNSIKTICKNGLEYLYEDVSVGYAIHQNNTLSVFSDQYYKLIVTWNYETEE